MVNFQMNEKLIQGLLASRHTKPASVLLQRPIEELRKWRLCGWFYIYRIAIIKLPPTRFFSSTLLLTSRDNI